MHVRPVAPSHLALSFSLVLIAGSTAVSGERVKWWQSAQVKAEIGLSEQQSHELESIFQTVLPRLRLEKQELDRQEEALSRLMREATVTEVEVGAAIDRVEAARARASKTRQLMLYRMYRVLSPEQRVNLKAMHERHKQDRRPSGSSLLN